MENMNTWGILILLFLLFIVFGGGFFGGNRRNEYGCNVVSNCQVEKTDIINTATTQNLINMQNEKTRDYLGNKIDFYAYEQLKDQLSQERSKNLVLENRVYSDEKFNNLERQYAACCCELNRRLDHLPIAPPYYSRGFVPTGDCIPPTCGA